jgi:DNA-binding transcriptional MerR regulator
VIEFSDDCDRISANPIFGQDVEVTTASVVKALKEHDITLQEIKKQLLILQERNNYLERELQKHKALENVPRSLSRKNSIELAKSPRPKRPLLIAEEEFWRRTAS